MIEAAGVSVRCLLLWPDCVRKTAACLSLFAGESAPCGAAAGRRSGRCSAGGIAGGCCGRGFN